MIDDPRYATRAQFNDVNICRPVIERFEKIFATKTAKEWYDIFSAEGLCCEILAVENNVKIEAEEILQKLGVPVSVVINSLYRQIIYHHGVPFSLTIPSEPRTIDVMTNVELDKKLQHSYAQSLAGEGRSMNEVFDDLERSLK